MNSVRNTKRNVRDLTAELRNKKVKVFTDRIILGYPGPVLQGRQGSLFRLASPSEERS